MVNSLTKSFTIHPPVQGGNYQISFQILILNDTPSRIGRKHMTVYIDLENLRYTLPYREETLYQIAPDDPKRDTPSRIGRKHSVFMRISATSNTSLCNLHK